jgi:hypothetical protein
LTLPDGTRIRDRETEESIVREAYSRWLVAKQAGEETATRAAEGNDQVTIEQVCLAYLANAKMTGSPKTYIDRADTLFDFCYGLPPRFRREDGSIADRLTLALRNEMAAARIHDGYGRLPVSRLIPLHLDQWLNRHETWKGGRRTRVQAVKRALNYAVDAKLIPANPVKGYKVEPPPGRITYITPKQEAALVKHGRRALRIAIRVCIRTGARFGCEFCKLSHEHVKDHGDRMEWVFPPRQSKTGRQKRRPRIIRITDSEIIRITREEMKRHRTGPIFRQGDGAPWTWKNLSQRFRFLKYKLEKQGMRFDEDCCMYSCRHTYAKRTLQGYWSGKATNIETLAQLMGNSAQVCCEHYLQWCESYTEPLWEAC